LEGTVSPTIILTSVVLPDAQHGEQRATGRHTKLHSSQLTGSVRSQNGHTRRETHLDLDIGQLIAIGPRITKVDTSHFKKLLSGRLHSLETTWIRKLELEIRGCKLKVMLCLWLLLDEGGHGASVMYYRKCQLYLKGFLTVHIREE
jgi:hypothetical protein